MRVYQSFSSAETKALGSKLAERISNFRAVAKTAMARRRQSPISKQKSAIIIALVGELGSGKTTFIQGFFRGLGIRKRATSPTFIIFRKLKIKNRKFKYVYHVDAYRIKKPRELLQLGLKKILADPKNIVLIEWADNIRKILPKSSAWIHFAHGSKGNERIIGF